MTQIEMIIEKTSTGFSLYSESYPIVGMGTTLEKAKEDLQDSIESWRNIQDGEFPFEEGEYELIFKL